MLRVTVELVPFGIEKHKRTLGQLEIANFGRKSDMDDTCLYHSRAPGKDWKFSTLHKRKDGFWKLVQRVLNASCPQEF